MGDKYCYVTKKELINGNFSSIDKVYIAKPDNVDFDLRQIIEDIGDNINAYKDWSENVFEDLMCYPQTHMFLDVVRETFSNNKLYTLGSDVEIDIEL